jgi:hypothetical protein
LSARNFAHPKWCKKFYPEGIGSLSHVPCALAFFPSLAKFLCVVTVSLRKILAVAAPAAAFKHGEKP